MPEHMHWSRQRRPQPKAFRTASGYWLHWILRGNFNKSKQHSYLGYFHLPIPFKRPTKESHTQYKHNQLKNIRQPANDNSHNEVIQDTSVVSAASRWATGGHGWYHWPTPAMCRWVNCTWKTNFEGFKAMSLDMSKLDRGFTGFGVWCHAFCFVEANLQHTCGRVLHRRPWHRHQSWWNTASSNHHFSAGLSQLNDPQLGYPCLNSVISQFSNLSLIKKNLDFSPIHTPKFPPPFGNFFPTFSLSKGQTYGETVTAFWLPDHVPSKAHRLLPENSRARQQPTFCVVRWGGLMMRLECDFDKSV